MTLEENQNFGKFWSFSARNAVFCGCDGDDLLYKKREFHSLEVLFAK